MSDEWDVGRVGCRTGVMSNGVMSDECDVGRVGCRTSGMSDEWDA